MLFNALILALRTIRRNLMRSFLTILGIVIGVASVIAMVMLGEGTTAYVTQSITKLGSNMLTIRPGQERRGPPRGDNSAKPFSMDDVEAIKREITALKAVTTSEAKALNAVYGNANYSTTVYGVDNDYFIIKDWSMERGREFSSSELGSGKSVCIIGKTVQKELFNNLDPIEADIRLEKFSCKVIGVLQSKGAAAFGRDQDDVILVPLKTFQRRISGNKKDISSIVVSVKDGVSTTRVQNEIKLLLRERRHIKQGKSDDFNIRDMKDIIQTLSSTTQMLTMLLGAVAAISLIVGGIGIMNIMLVSVTERTREIGIRLAIGALEREVLMQFLVESVVLSSIGGIIGIILGISITAAATSIFDIPFIFNQGIVVIAFVFSMIVGIVFGYFPARKAAKMNPIDALRYE
ncbi:MAG: ABC transporter permease [Campylobacterales bacterium]|nr:ABC transporter permease [Campylobacterales bacterium]